MTDKNELNTVNVQVSVKVAGVDKYSPVEVSAGYTVAPPTGNMEELAAYQKVLYEQLSEAVKEQAEALAAAMRNGAESAPDYAGYVEPPAKVETPAQQQQNAHGKHQQATAPTGDAPLVNFRAAKERVPGEMYWVEVDEYEREGQKIKFFGPNSQYAKESTYVDRAAFVKAFSGFDKWQEGKHPMPGGTAYLLIEVSEKKAGNYYDTNVIGVERERAKVAA